MTTQFDFDFETIIQKFDTVLARGLCRGMGTPDGQMCVEAAIGQALGLPFDDKPSCVEPAVRAYNIALNDKYWSTPEARARGLRDLGIAQIGSAGVVDGKEFTRRLAEKTIRVLIPHLFREVFPHRPQLLAAASRCEEEGTLESAYEARQLASAYADDDDDAAAAYATAAAAYDAAYAATAYATAYDATYDAAYAATASAATASASAYSVGGDKYLLLSARPALEVLRELKSPGCEWISNVRP